MTLWSWVTGCFCVGTSRHEEVVKTEVVKAIPVRSAESTVFHKSVAEFESLQYKPAEIKSREDSQREREITMYIVRHSHGRVEAQRAAEEKVWEKEAQVRDMNHMWQRAKTEAHLQEEARIAALEQAWELERQQAWQLAYSHATEMDENEPEPEPEPEPDRMTRQSRKSRLNIETHLSPRSRCCKHTHRNRNRKRNSNGNRNSNITETTQFDPLETDM